MVQKLKKQFDSEAIENMYIDKNIVEAQVERILKNHPIHSRKYMCSWLLKAISVIDLTTLSGDDTNSNVTRLCIRAANPLSKNTLMKIIEESNKEEKYCLRTAAVCVYPSKVPDAYSALKRMGLLEEIKIASVATGFPSGLFPIETRLAEIKFAVEAGATEIDVVIDRSLALCGKWDILFEEIQKMKEACGDAHLKVILGVGELGTYANVYKASMVSMLAGADFIKTSTGKEAVNATLPVGLVMCRAIRTFYQMTGIKVGLKPAGGIKTSQDAVNWLILVRNELGMDWLDPKLFRIGASSLLDVLENELCKIAKEEEEE